MAKFTASRVLKAWNLITKRNIQRQKILTKLLKRVRPVGSDMRCAFNRWSTVIDRTNQELKQDLLTVVGTVH